MRAVPNRIDESSFVPIDIGLATENVEYLVNCGQLLFHLGVVTYSRTHVCTWIIIPTRVISQSNESKVYA